MVITAKRDRILKKQNSEKRISLYSSIIYVTPTPILQFTTPAGGVVFPRNRRRTAVNPLPRQPAVGGDADADVRRGPMTVGDALPRVLVLGVRGQARPLVRVPVGTDAKGRRWQLSRGKFPREMTGVDDGSDRSAPPLGNINQGKRSKF